MRAPLPAEKTREYLGYRWKWSLESHPGKTSVRKRRAEQQEEREEDEENEEGEEDESNTGSDQDEDDDDDNDDDDDALDPIFAASLSIGAKLQAKDDDTKRWYEASVVDTRTNLETAHEEVKVHFRGFGTKALRRLRYGRDGPDIVWLR